MKINLTKWNERRIAVETEIKLTRKWTREPGHMIGSSTALKMTQLAKEATTLYMLRAELRNHLHTDKFTRDEQLAYVLKTFAGSELLLEEGVALPTQVEAPTSSESASAQG